LGREALETLTVGNNNVALGNFSLELQNSSENTAVGNYSGQNNTSTDQVMVGYSAGQFTTSGAGQTFVGHNAGKGISGGGLLTGTNNTAVGRDSGLVLQGNAFSNSFYGANSGTGVTTGDKNCYIGHDSGSLMTTGQENTILGAYDGNQDDLDIRTGSNNLVLADGAGAIKYFSGSDNTVRRSAFGGGNFYEFHIHRSAAAKVKTFTLTSNAGSNNSFFAHLKISNIRFTEGLGLSEWIIQGDLPGSNGDAVYRTINGSIAGGQSYSIANTAASPTSITFTITLNDTYSCLFIEAQAIGYSETTATLTMA